MRRVDLATVSVCDPFVGYSVLDRKGTYGGQERDSVIPVIKVLKPAVLVQLLYTMIPDYRDGRALALISL